MREVSAMIWVQRAAVDGRERACVDKGALNGVVDKEEEKHCEGEVRERICYCNASKSIEGHRIRAKYTRPTRLSQYISQRYR